MERILEFLSSFEESLLLAVNGSHTPFMNIIMWQYSAKWVWVPFYVFLLVLIIRRHSWVQVCKIAVCIFLVILLTDQVCASWIRPLVARDRPSHSELGVLLHYVNGYKGGNYGFPSCHAANTGALTAFLCCVFRGKLIPAILIVWALLMGYSRMYLGVHYPSDLLVGYLVGGGIGSAIGYGWIKRRPIGRTLLRGTRLFLTYLPFR